MKNFFKVIYVFRLAMKLTHAGGSTDPSYTIILLQDSMRCGTHDVSALAPEDVCIVVFNDEKMDPYYMQSQKNSLVEFMFGFQRQNHTTEYALYHITEESEVLKHGNFTPLDSGTTPITNIQFINTVDEMVVLKPVFWMNPDDRLVRVCSIVPLSSFCNI